MLQLSHITKSYITQTVLADVSFIVNAGERVGLIGPNGCGQTTVLRIIAGELAPTEGSVRIGANVKIVRSLTVNARGSCLRVWSGRV